jgi:hypothetical protein
MKIENEELVEFQIGSDGTFSIDFDDEGELINPAKEDSKEKSENKEDSDTGKFIIDPDTYGQDEDEDEDTDDEDSKASTKKEKKVVAKTSTSEDNPYKVFAQSLIENEVLLSLDENEDIESEEDLVNHVIKTRDTLVNDALAEINDKSYGAVDFFLNGGTPEEFIKTFENKPSIFNFSEEEITSKDDVKRKIAEAYFKNKGFEGKKLDKFITNSIDLDEPSDFIEMQEELSKVDKQKKEEFIKKNKEKEEIIAKQKQEFNSKLEENTFNTNEFIPGKKIDKKIKEKVFENIPQVLSKVNKDLSKYAPILAYLDHYGILDGKFDKIMKDVETKQTTKLGEILKSTTLKSRGNSNNNYEEDIDLKTAAKASLPKYKRSN